MLILEKSSGNPFVCREFCLDLCTMDLEALSTRGQLNVTVPHMIQAMLAPMCDRLTIHQKMILKVAAVMGEVFNFDVLKQAYPMEPNDDAGKRINLDDEVAEMVQLKLLHRISNSELQEMAQLSLSQQFPPQFTYINGFMRDYQLSKCLTAHFDSLVKSIKAVDPSFTPEDLVPKETESDKNMISTMSNGQEKMFSESLFEGFLTKSGGKFKSWKERYFVLFYDKIWYFQSNKDVKTADLKGEIPLYSETQVQLIHTYSMHFLLVPSVGERQYEIHAKTAVDAETWVNAITRVVDNLRQSKMDTLNKRQSRVGPQMNSGSQSYTPEQMKQALVDSDAALQNSKVFRESVKEGYMLKRGDTVKSWKKRYFILFQDKIMYFKDKSNTGLVQGEIQLTQNTLCSEDKESGVGGFVICPQATGRKFFITAGDAAQASEWINAIVNQIKQSKGAEQKVANHSMKEGFLRKKGGTLGTWKSRFLILFGDKIQYFEDKHKAMTGQFDVSFFSSLSFRLHACIAPLFVVFVVAAFLLLPVSSFCLVVDGLLCCVLCLFCLFYLYFTLLLSHRFGRIQWLQLMTKTIAPS